MYRIALRVTGVDLESDEVFERLDRCSSELAWAVADGRVLATLYVEDREPVGAAIQAVRCVAAVLPMASVVEVDPDLVNVADIARRVGVSREAVRLWSEGKRGPGGFPEYFGAVGDGDRGGSRIWLWADVNPWLRSNYSLGDEEIYLDADQRAELNARLRRIRQDIDKEWEAVRPPGLNVRSHVTNLSATWLTHAPETTVMVGKVSYLTHGVDLSLGEREDEPVEDAW